MAAFGMVLSIWTIPIRWVSSPKTERARQRCTAQRADLPQSLMDTPYRLPNFLGKVQQAFGKKQRVFLACDLSSYFREALSRTIEDVIRQTNNRKAEFIYSLINPREAIADREDT